MTKVKQSESNVCYVGSDSGFFQNIIQRFRMNYATLKFDFPTHNVGKNFLAEQEFLNLMSLNPKIIYFDFCKDKEEMLRLAEITSRDPFFYDIPLVGLVDKKEDTLSCLGTGMDFIYVKGGEFHDLVYAPMTMAFAKQVIKPKFAQAKMNKEVNLIDDFRVGYISPTHIHVEGNFFLEEGKTVFFDNLIPPKNIPSKNFEVKNRSEQNLYYDYNYGYDLDFKFVDPPEVTDEKEEQAQTIEDEKERVKALKEAKQYKRDQLAEFEDSFKRSQKKHKDWVLDQMDGQTEKKTKLMIVDESMRAFSQMDENTLENIPYSVRFQTQLDQSFLDLDKLRPAILAYQVMGEYGPEVEEEFQIALDRIKNFDESNFVPDEDPDKEKIIAEMVEAIPTREKEETSYISILIQLVKEMENYSPIIVIFRSYFQSSKALQESFQYPMLVTHSENLNIQVCLNLAKIYESKQEEKMDKLIRDKVAAMKAKDPQKYRRLTEDDFKEKKFFIKKSNPLSYGSIKLPIILSTMTESELTFKTELHLPMKTYRLDNPLSLSIHLVPIDGGRDFLEERGLRTYRGIIHSISETDKKTLRQLVNEVFFEPLKEKREKERAEFNDLNAKVKKDIEDEKLTEEEKEKLAQDILGIDSEKNTVKEPNENKEDATEKDES